MDENDPPPIPPKLYPQLELEIPAEELNVLHIVTDSTNVDSDSNLLQKPSPAPRTSLQTAKHKTDVVKPVPKPRNIAVQPRIVENPVYFTVNIKNAGKVTLEQAESCDDGHIDNCLPNERSNIVDDEEQIVPNELTLEFDPFAPGKASLGEAQTALHLTASVFALDQIVSSNDGDFDTDETNSSHQPDAISQETKLFGDIQLSLDQVTDETSAGTLSPILEASSISVQEFAQCSDLSHNFEAIGIATKNGSSLKESVFLPQLVPEGDMVEIHKHVKHRDSEEINVEPNDNRLSTIDFDPPAFPPPPLPDGFSSSISDFLETECFLESLEMFATITSQPMLPPRQNLSTLSSPFDKPPLPPKSNSRSQTPELGKPSSSSPVSSLLTNKTRAVSSTESSPDLKHRQIPNVVMEEKIPKPPPKSKEIQATIAPKPIRSATTAASSVDEPAPPLPPKSRGHSRTKSWNFGDLMSVCSLLRSSISSKINSNSSGTQMNNCNNSRPTLLNKDSSDYPNSRPALVNRVLQSFPHSGILYKTGSNRKDFRQRWCVLESGHLKYYTDEKAEIPQNTIHCRDMISIGKVFDVKNNAYDLSCFEINTLKDKGRSYLFGAPIPSERESWMEHVVLSIAHPTCRTDNRDFIKAGYTYVRFGMTGTWFSSWLLLRNRVLRMTNIDDEKCEQVDLRKTMNIQMNPADHIQSCPGAIEEGSSFHLDFPGKSFYIQAHLRKDTDGWFMLLRNSIYDIGETLDTQQLTTDDVPVIVEKCVTFVGVHGCTSEGIYRLNGTSSKVSKLLIALKQDAWGFSLKTDDYTVHEVATALKRFLRTLPDPIFTAALYDQWLKASALEKQKDQLATYEKLLQQLPKINYRTLKCLIKHLRSINDNSNTNLMTTNNLASIFGPTLMSTEVDGCVPNLLNTNMEMDVVADLINNYPVLFKVSAEELKKDLVIQKALIEMKEAKRWKKPAGDILIGVYIYDKEWGKCLNVRISPSMTTQDLCLYAIHNIRIKERVEHLTVFEVVSNGEMERPLHYSEIVLSVTLQWARWSDSEAKDNYLVIKKNELYHSVLPMARQPISMFSELRFADRKSKHFKKTLLEFKNARLSFYKDAKITQPEGTWNIEDIVWYIGAEQKRPTPTKWAFTFIDKKDGVKRTKDTPYFGWTVCCSLEDEFYKWIAAMLIGEYPNGLLPRKETIDLLT